VPGTSAFRIALALVTAVTVAFAGLEIVLLITHHEALPGVLVLFPIIALIYLAAGVVAWWRRPSNRFGLLLIGGALAFLAAGLLDVTIPAVAAVGLITAELPLAVVLHLLLAFPSGRLRGGADRVAVALIYFETVVLEAGQWLFGPQPNAPGLTIADRPDLVDLASSGKDILSWTAALITIVVLTGRFRAAGPVQRPVLGPLYLYGVAVWVFVPLAHHVIPPLLGQTEKVLVQLALLAGIPVAFTLAIRRGGFAQMAELDEQSAWLALRSGGHAGLTRALARALGDPGLRLVLAAPSQGAGYVDARGDPAPDPGPGEASVNVEVGGRRVGAIVYDATLIGDPDVVRAAARTVAVALDHQRLTLELTRSRARIVDAADQERRRIARDLHDGMQSRLVLLGMEASMVLPDLPPASRTAISELRDGLESSVRELGELVQGLMPSALLERGLSAAVEDLADRMPTHTQLDIEMPADGRALSPATELTAYLVVAEALSNAVKHANAQTLQVSLRRYDGQLRVEVRDDGTGGAAAHGATGIRSMADRVDAVGGVLWVDSPPGAGTRVTAEIPCAS
jgi:signal transduction histidine kinase